MKNMLMMNKQINHIHHLNIENSMDGSSKQSVTWNFSQKCAFCISVTGWFQEETIRQTLALAQI